MWLFLEETVSHCFRMSKFLAETDVITLTSVAVFWKSISLSCLREVDIFSRYGALCNGWEFARKQCCQAFSHFCDKQYFAMYSIGNPAPPPFLFICCQRATVNHNFSAVVTLIDILLACLLNVTVHLCCTDVCKHDISICLDIYLRSTYMAFKEIGCSLQEHALPTQTCRNRNGENGYEVV